MDMLQLHAEALKSENIVIHCFLLCYKPSKRIVYGIVEGNGDPAFYRGLIEHHLPNGWNVELIPSGGKEKVLKAFQEMDWSKYPKKRICFFVDRDLSEFLEEKLISGPNLYITNNYSIENEVVTFYMMERIQKEIFGVTTITESEMRKLQSAFEYNLSNFQEMMAPIMAQVLLWRRNGKKVSLNNIHLKNLFIFTDGGIKAKFSSPIEGVNEAANYVGVTAATPENLAVAEIEFRENQGLEKFIRGKYLLWFFVQYALEIHKNIHIFCSHYTSPPKCHFPFSHKTAMNVLAPRVRCPDSLKDFIMGNYVEFIREAESVA